MMAAPALGQELPFALAPEISPQSKGPHHRGSLEIPVAARFDGRRALTRNERCQRIRPMEFQLLSEVANYGFQGVSILGTSFRASATGPVFLNKYSATALHGSSLS